MNNHIAEYKNSKDTCPVSTTINNFLGKMSDEDSPVLFYREKLKAFGKEHTHTKQVKESLPCAIFSGTFTGGKRLEHFNVDTWTNTLCIDVDKLKDNEDALRVKALIADHPSCSAAFISPSGNGIKALLNVGGLVGSNRTEKVDYFKTIFRKVEFHFLQEYQITLDKQCSNLNRLCFLSYDKDVYINDDAEEMDIAEMHDPDNNAQCFADIDAGGSNTNYPKLTPDEVRSMLECVPHSDYERWLQVGMGLKEWDQFLGLELWDSWSQEDLKAWKDGECARKWQTFSRHSITLATVRDIAQKNGWAKDINKNKVIDSEPTNDLITRMNLGYSVINLGGKTKVAKRMDNGSYDFMSFQSYKELQLNKTVLITEGEKTKKVSEGVVWLASPDRKEYSQGLEFYPMVSGGSDRGNGKLNLWSGFAYNPIKFDINKIKPAIDYIKDVVCSGNEEYYRYLIRWIARGFQRPHLQAEVAIILRGKKGSGKSTLGNLLAPLWGEHAKQISSATHITGNFNGHLNNCCFLAGEESIYHGDKKGEAALKALITESTLIIEKKGFEAVQVRNCLKIVLTANSEWVVPTSEDERRFLCFNVVDNFDTKKASTEFYNALYGIIGDDEYSRDEEALAMLLDYFLSYDLTGFNHRVYPETEENRKQRAQSLGFIPQFLIESCERGYFFNNSSIRSKSEGVWESIIHTDALKLALDEWGKANYKSSYDKVSTLELKNYLGKTLKLSNKNSRNTVAYRNEEFSRVHTRGWQVGSAKDLLLKVVTTENLLYSEYFGDEEMPDDSEIGF